MYKTTYFDVLEKAKAKGYTIPLPVELLLGSAQVGLDKKFKGDGVILEAEMEADRINLFKAIFGEEWEVSLCFAHDKFIAGDIKLAVDFVRAYLDGIL